VVAAGNIVALAGGLEVTKNIVTKGTPVVSAGTTPTTGPGLIQGYDLVSMHGVWATKDVEAESFFTKKGAFGQNVNVLS
jgi:hypothetical protein